MPIYTKHPQYQASVDRWIEYRATTAGGRAVKHSSVAKKFLPMLTGETADEYKARKQRALFYAATRRTVEGLIGAIFRKDPIQLPELDPDNDKDVRNHITKEGFSELELLYYIVSEVVKMGRIGLLTDFPTNENKDPNVAPFITTYVAESIINWKYRVENGREVLEWLVLQESYVGPGADKFVQKARIQFRELAVEDGIYIQRIWRAKETGDKSKSNDNLSPDNWTVFKGIVPEVSGGTLSEIPFDFVNPYNSNANIEDSPIDGVSEVNISHYHNSADLEHGRHFTGLPTAVLGGFDTVDAEGNPITYRIGSSTALVSKDVEVKASYMEVKGNFRSLQDGMSEKQALMAVLGARILDETKTAVEAAETHKLRRVGENSILASVSKSVSKTYTKHVKRFAKWARMPNYQQYKLALNTDFNVEKLGAQELTALVLAWQNGAMSDQTLVYNYKQGELLTPGWTIEQEIIEILKKLKEKRKVEADLSASQQNPKKTLGKLDDPENPGDSSNRDLRADRTNANQNTNALKKNS